MNQSQRYLDPNTDWFRGTWLVGYLRLCDAYVGQTSNKEREKWRATIAKLVPQIREAWNKYCQNVGRLDQTDRWILAVPTEYRYLG